MSSDFNLAIGFSVLFSFSVLTQDAEAQRFRFRYRNHSQPVRSAPTNCSNFRSVAPAQTMVAYPHLPRRASQPSYKYTIQPVRPVFTDPMQVMPTAKPGDAVRPAMNYDAPPTQMLNPVAPSKKTQPMPQTTPTAQPVTAHPAAKKISKSPQTVQPVPSGETRETLAIGSFPATLPPHATPGGPEPIHEQSN